MSKNEEATVGSRNNRGLVVLIYVGIGLLTTLLLIGFKFIIEHTSWGREAELWTFGKLQGSLSKIDTDNPIILLDISDLPGGKEGQPTPRSQLKEIIGALADQRPLAIAVDIDFSPEPNRFAAEEEDPDFFEFCLDIRNNRKVPIFLAVGKRKAARPHEWLGQEEYKELAVAVAADIQDTSRLPLWVRAQSSGENEKLKTMSYTLALEYRKHLPEAPAWINWAVVKNVEGAHEESHHEESLPDEAVLIYADRLVNYSKLDAFKLAAQKDTSAQSVKETGNRYQGKLVILGDVSQPADFFPVPGRRLNEGGCLLHASATYTLIKEPLFEFKHWVRLLLDFVIAVFIIAMVAIIRYRHPGDPKKWVDKQTIFTGAAIIGVFIAGWILVRVSGVMWLDFLFVAFALFLHPKLEHRIHKFFESRKKPKQPEQQPPSGGGQPAPETDKQPTLKQDEQPSLKKDAPQPAETEGAGVKAALCILAAILMLPSTAQAQDQANRLCQERRVAAVALKFHLKGKKGKCYWRENKKAKWQVLSAADAETKPFRAGQHLHCDKGCRLEILLCGTGERYPVTQNPPRWYPVLNAYSSPLWLDRFKAIPARKAQNFTPGNPHAASHLASLINRSPEVRGVVNTMFDLGAGYISKRQDRLAQYEKKQGLIGGIAPPRPTPKITQSKQSAKRTNAGAGKYPSRAATPAPTPATTATTSTAVAAPATTPTSTPTPSSTTTTSSTVNSSGSDKDVAEANAEAIEMIMMSAPAKTTESSAKANAGLGELINAPAMTAEPSTEEDAQKAAKLEPEEPGQKLTTMLRTGNVARSAKNYSDAERIYTEVRQLVPNDWRASYGLGNVYADQKKWKEAEQAYRRALELNFRSPEIYMALGFVMLQPGEGGVTADRLAQAETNLWFAATLTPGNETAYELLDVVLEKRGASIDDVERIYRSAVALNPRSVNANLRLSGLLRSNGHKDEAEKYLDIAENLAYSTSDIQKVAETLESLRRYEKAESWLRIALVHDVSDPRTLYILGRVLTFKKRYAEAIKLLKLAVEFSPEGFTPRYLLGVAQLRAGNPAEAERAFEDALTKAPAEEDELLAIAYSLASVGDAYTMSERLADGVRLYEKALRYDPDDTETKDKLAETRARLRR